jgi:beta-galactosidase
MIVMRRDRHLNFDWKFGFYEERHLKGEGYDLLKSIDLPHNAVDVPFNNFNEQMTLSVFSYVKMLEVADELKGKTIRLVFEGVAHRANVYLNSKHIGEHLGGYTPFEFEISKDVEYGKDNTLLVVVDTQEHPDIPPFGGVVDYLGYGGIYREVHMVSTDPSYIKDVFIEQDGTQDLSIHLKISKPHGQVQLQIKDIEGHKVYHEKYEMNVSLHTILVHLDQVRLWSIDDPHLYTLIVSYVNDKDSDQIEQKFGIRRGIFKKDGFYLNDQMIKLRGLNRHQSYPYVGYAMPKHAQEEDANLLKYELGVNIVRTSHYPQSIHFLNRCDEIGLLVFEEIPGWQHIGNEVWKQIAIENVSEMIIRDRNHPSIILWGVRINESPDDHDFYVKTNELAHRLDPSRPTAGVRNFAFSEFLEDVYTYNDFSHTGQNPGLSDKDKITKDVPYLVTEYNGHMYPTKRYDDETHRIEHTKRHLNVLDAMMKPGNGISGCIGWCMNDYNTHQEFGSGDKICYHGVLDMFRIPKMAAFAYMTEGKKDPFMAISSTMNIGEYPGGNIPNALVFTNVDEIKLYKNDVYIKTFKPNRKAYPNLIHPPVQIDDLIGDTLMKQERMSESDAEMTKRILKSITTHGNRLSLKHKLQTLYLLKKYKMTYDEGVKMFFRYMSGWGSQGLSYRFEGYRDGKLVRSITKGNTHQTDLIVETDQHRLSIENTYDVKRYVIQKVNQDGQLLHYASDVISLRAEGSIEIIGPTEVALQGGAIGFWVKTKSKGQGTISIKSAEKTIQIGVDVS